MCWFVGASSMVKKTISSSRLRCDVVVVVVVPLCFLVASSASAKLLSNSTMTVSKRSSAHDMVNLELILDSFFDSFDSGKAIPDAIQTDRNDG